MNVIAIIPERLESSRFPGKPLAKICGIPMVGHIYARVKMAKEIDGVYLASPDKEILDYVRSRGGKGGLESTPPKNAPTTVKMALPEIERNFGKKIDWVIMVQGDEPMIDPNTIDELVLYIRSHLGHKVINLVTELVDEKEYFDQNIVKIVLNQKSEGIWFFRTPSERWKNSMSDLPIKKQTGIIAFRKDFLVLFGEGEKTSLEKIESVDMFNLIERGETIPVFETKKIMYSVDTPEDRDIVEDIMKSDPLVQLYEENFKN